MSEAKILEVFFVGFRWRWRNLGGGEMGDMGCHHFDTTFDALKLTAPAGVIDLSTNVDFDTWTFTQPLRLAATGLDLASVAPPMAGKVDASGDLQLIGFTDFTWKGAVTATHIAWPSGGAARIATPITVAKDGQTISWDAPSAVIDSGRVDALRSLRPARYAAATRGDFNLKTQTVELYQATLRGSPGDVSARGTYGVRDGRMNFQGTARFARLADVAPLTGSARSLWSVSQASKSAPIRITADAQGRDVTSSIAALQQLAGPEPRVKLSAVVRGGRFVLESGNVTGAGIRATMTGRVADNGAITARAQGALTRPLDLSGATLGAMDFAADITGDDDLCVDPADVLAKVTAKTRAVVPPSLEPEPCEPATTRALLLMFCALNGATLRPWRA